MNRKQKRSMRKLKSRMLQCARLLDIEIGEAWRRNEAFHQRHRDGKLIERIKAYMNEHPEIEAAGSNIVLNEVGLDDEGRQLIEVHNLTDPVWGIGLDYATKAFERPVSHWSVN